MSQAQPKSEKYAGAMPDMTDEKFEALKRSIEENGFDESQPIVLDADGNVVDGHHRERAADAAGVEPVYVTDEDATAEDAYRRNLARRNLTGGEMREAVKRYLERHFDGERTQAEVASELGVSEGTVSNACKELKDEDFTREEKRQQASDYLDENPDASPRQVAESIEADVSHPTVRKWMDEWQSPDGEPGDESTESTETDEDSTGTVEDTLSNPATDTDENSPSEETDVQDGGVGTAGANVSTNTGSTDGGEAGSQPSQSGADASDTETDAGSEGDTADPDPGESGEPMPSPTDVSEGVGEEIVAGPTKQELQAENKRLAGRVEELEGHLSDVVTHYQRQDVEELGNAVERAEEALA